MSLSVLEEQIGSCESPVTRLKSRAMENYATTENIA